MAISTPAAARGTRATARLRTGAVVIWTGEAEIGSLSPGDARALATKLVESANKVERIHTALADLDVLKGMAPRAADARCVAASLLGFANVLDQDAVVTGVLQRAMAEAKA